MSIKFFCKFLLFQPIWNVKCSCTQKKCNNWDSLPGYLFIFLTNWALYHSSSVVKNWVTMLSIHFITHLKLNLPTVQCAEQKISSGIKLICIVYIHSFWCYSNPLPLASGTRHVANNKLKHLYKIGLVLFE